MTEFKTGVKVLIPGTIREIIGTGRATIETVGQNHIVERLADLQPAASCVAENTSGVVGATGLEINTEVLIPGKVVGWTGRHEVIVQTTSGARFVAFRADLGLPRGDGSVEERIERLDKLIKSREGSVEERIERLARVMALADECDPDQKAMLYEPMRKARGFILEKDSFPAWRLYARYARAVVDGGPA